VAKSNTIFDHIEFDPYEFREFPKHVYPEGLTYPADHSEAHLRGKPMGVEVNSPEEERSVMSAERPLDGEPANRAQVRQQLATLGVQVDPTWDMERLYSELAYRAKRLAMEHSTEYGQGALGGDPGEVEWGTEPEDTESERRAAESFNREPQLHSEDPKPGGDRDMVDLRMQAAALGLKVDNRWSVGRLRDEISSHQEPKVFPDDYEAENEMARLRMEAGNLGIKVDGRWSTQRLREEIARVTDPDFDPDAA
jgi:hypothetical protein